MTDKHCSCWDDGFPCCWCDYNDDDKPCDGEATDCMQDEGAA